VDRYLLPQELSGKIMKFSLRNERKNSYGNFQEEKENMEKTLEIVSSEKLRKS